MTLSSCFKARPALCRFTGQGLLGASFPFLLSREASPCFPSFSQLHDSRGETKMLSPSCGKCSCGNNNIMVYSRFIESIFFDGPGNPGMPVASMLCDNINATCSADTRELSSTPTSTLWQQDWCWSCCARTEPPSHWLKMASVREAPCWGGTGICRGGGERLWVEGGQDAGGLWIRP